MNKRLTKHINKIDAQHNQEQNKLTINSSQKIKAKTSHKNEGLASMNTISKTLVT